MLLKLLSILLGIGMLMNTGTAACATGISDVESGIVQAEAVRRAIAEQEALEESYRQAEKHQHYLDVKNNNYSYFDIPDLEFAVPCTYSDLMDGYAQYYCDMQNMASLFYDYDWGTLMLGDHNTQGFDVINNFTPGMICTLVVDGVATDYVCRQIDLAGYNCGYTLTYSDGSVVDNTYPFIAYTCSGDGVHITIVAFDVLE